MKILLTLLALGSALSARAASAPKSLYDFQVHSLAAGLVKLADYRGKVVLIVNTASKCGFTPQYAGLQKIYDRYHAKGLEILGFPSNDFGKQEPGDAKEIKNFCDTKYHVKFPLMEKNPVSGSLRQPLYDWLVTNDPGEKGSAVKWNFEKFLISKDGRVVQRFRSKVEPESPELTAAIEKQL